MFTVANSLLKQIKKRRLAFGLKQKDMLLRIGISRQQYQHLESKGNPRLETLELIAQGLNAKLMLIPKEKFLEVSALLENKSSKQNLSDDPWQDLLEDE